MDIRVECPCGQAYEFPVEPVNNLMPCPVACPACGTDGTALANQFIRSTVAPTAIPIPPPVPVSSGLRINREQPASAVPAAAAAPIPPPPLQRPPPPPGSRVAGAAIAASRQTSDAPSNNLGLGILGAFVGAAVGAGLMYGFFMLTGVRFPLIGTSIGALSGLGARMLFRGTDHALGVIAGGISLVTVVGTFYMMFGDFAILNIISVAVSVSFAYRIAS